MKRKLFIFLIGLMMICSFSSCDVYTYATTQDDIYVETEVDVVRSNVSFDVIIRYGTPYFIDGVLLYYLYNDIYYYPYYYNNYWYVRAYRRPFTHFDHHPYFRPHKYDYKFSPGLYRGFDRPNKSRFNAPNIRRVEPIRRPNNRRVDRQPNRVRPQAQPNRDMPTRPQVRQQTKPQTPIRTTPRNNGNNRSGNFRSRR